ncbi:MAG TPA: hypothetical protein VJA18_04555 [Candidatus Nanoarchaeia archaeon]|nr:hypothetical protein [Candidatus Nanoarchaeia archaeon]
MDLDEMMSKVYVRSTRDERVGQALDCYVDVLNQYGDNSPEEKTAYTVFGAIFPEMNGLCDTTKELKAAFERGELPLSPGDLEAVGLKEE